MSSPRRGKCQTVISTRARRGVTANHYPPEVANDEPIVFSEEPEPADGDLTDEETGPEEPKSIANKIGTIISLIVAVAVIIAAIVAIVLLLIVLLPGHVEIGPNPGVLDNIFGNRWVIFAARLLLVVGALFALMLAVHAAASVFAWFRHGRWLTSVGPYRVDEAQVSEQVRRLGEELEWLRAQQGQENEEVQLLLETNKERDELFSNYVEYTEALEKENAELRARLESSEVEPDNGAQ